MANDGVAEGEGLSFSEEAVGKEVDGVGQEVVVELLQMVGDKGGFSQAGGGRGDFGNDGGELGKFGVPLGFGLG